MELEDNRKKRGTKKQGDWWVKAENQWEKCGEKEREWRWGEVFYSVGLKEKEITIRWRLLDCYELCPTLLLSLLVCCES